MLPNSLSRGRAIARDFTLFWQSLHHDGRNCRNVLRALGQRRCERRSVRAARRPADKPDGYAEREADPDAHDYVVRGQADRHSDDDAKADIQGIFRAHGFAI
jgi:hypothetical protein